MPESYYKEAKKRAEREFRACTARGEYPCLPVLDDFISAERISRGIDMGSAQVPMEFVVGTRTGGRTSAFARNFMPLLDEGSEFAMKWQALCRAHLAEGIRDAVKLYEYMNRYYVEEGNKRVSVLKFFGATTVYAHIIRIPPEQSDTREVKLYLELIEFERVSGINDLEFSKPGSCAELTQLLGKAPGERWSDEDRAAFAASSYYFRQAYEQCGGKQLPTTIGDAMLAFIRVYGYQGLRGSPEETRKRLLKVWEEITLQQEEAPIDVKLTPEEKKPGLLTKVLSAGEKKELKAAFIHDKNPLDSGWTRGHEAGRAHVQRVFGDKIQTTAYFDALSGDPAKVIEQAIDEGNTVLFTTSPRLLSAALRAAVDHPDVTILNCSLNKPHRYIRMYYARMYEAKFIIGAMAGSMAEDDRIGYLCNYPIFGQIAGINAFALGAQMANPRAKVYLEWSAVGGAHEARKRLTQRGIRLISSLDLAKQGEDSRSNFGLFAVTDGGRETLAVPVWQWGVYYESIIRRIRDKTFQAEYEQSGKALNYYWGMSAGVIDLHCSSIVPASTRRMAELLQNSIRANLFRPFDGQLRTQEGQELTGELSPEQIIAMDWLASNVEGSIPVYDELDETGKATVDMVGVERAAKEPRGSV